MEAVPVWDEVALAAAREVRAVPADAEGPEGIIRADPSGPVPDRL